MTQFELKYGTNPNQKPSRIFMKEGQLPITVINGRPGYINFLDALNSYQLVRELHRATGIPAAASFKHVSPAGAAIGLPLTDIEKQMFFAPEGDISPLAAAYVRARGADRTSSYGDWAALSDICDEDAAMALKPDFSDGVIAPGYTDGAIEILKSKRKGAFNIVQIDKDYIPSPLEQRDVFGITFEQGRNDLLIERSMLENVVTEKREIPETSRLDLLISLITLKFTQSNSVAYVKNGGAIGIGAGQQSRIYCTRLAGSKADKWHLRSHKKVLELPFLEDLPRAVRDNAIDAYITEDYETVLGDLVWESYFKNRPERLTEDEKTEWIGQLTDVSLGSDAFFPFEDNVERASRSGVRYIAQPGGSIRDTEVIEACNRYGIAMAFTGTRLFHH